MLIKKGIVQQGVTLIELVIALVILGLLLAFGIPSFAGWIQNAKIRNAAEATQNGLQLARAEAVKRNVSVRFQLTDTLDNTCALSATGSNWVVSINNVTGGCGSSPAAPPLPPTAPDPANPYIVQARSGAEGSDNVAIATTPATTTITFNGLGRVTPAPASNIDIDFTNTNGTCKASGGNLTCLRISVAIGGQIFLCDPSVGSTTDTRHCP